jgi:DNA topoisomerase IA
MTKAHVQAHPMIEPLDYGLTPEAARDVLAGDALEVYGLLWNAALATLAEGPVVPMCRCAARR